MCARGTHGVDCAYAGIAIWVCLSEWGGGDKYSGGTLSAATQTQAGSIPGVFICACAWLCASELRQKKQGRVVPRREVFAFRESGNYMRVRRR